MLSYLEISKENLIHNFKTLRDFLHEKTKIVSVVKANAYGHGQDEVVGILEPLTDYFGIDDIEELRKLRAVSKKPALVLGYVAKSDLEEAVELGGILVIYDLERAKILDGIGERLGKKIKIHVKIDAALGRQGILVGEAEDFARKLAGMENLEVEAVYAHFANIEDTSDFSHAQKQIDEFQKAVESFKRGGFENIQVHISATSGVLAYEQDKGLSDIVRPGIGLYGMWPSNDLRKKIEASGIIFKPVMRWISHVAQIKTVPEGYSVGYGLTYVTSRETKVAVIPQGYSDGFDRGLSNKGEVLIKGTRCPVLGRVAMNIFVVDVTHLAELETEEEVVLLGCQGHEEITAEEIAEKLETINYEITTRVSALLPRVIV
ncbi:MAG: Alanine racemase 2 [Candidatus Moranbacteria bacterium GW2011_GWC2_45_10]|nr:MAG: Alanine racemase 2 [Candidatus Moranbacteria bacterium GW2011_GWC2_45_10]